MIKQHRNLQNTPQFWKGSQHNQEEEASQMREKKGENGGGAWLPCVGKQLWQRQHVEWCLRATLQMAIIGGLRF
jgi:hypothetical protein